MKKHAWNIQDAPAKQASFPGAKLGDANTDEQTSKEKRDGTSEDTFNMSSTAAHFLTTSAQMHFAHPFLLTKIV